MNDDFEKDDEELFEDDESYFVIGDDEDALHVIKVKDEMNNDVEFVVVDAVSKNGVNYMLVVELEFADDDNVEAVILKEVSKADDDSIYEIMEDGPEFDMAFSLFSSNEDYDIEK